MTKTLRVWAAIVAALAGGLGLAGMRLRSDAALPFYERPAATIVLGIAAALALAAVAGLVVSLRRSAAEGADEDGAWRSRPYVALFLISFVALFVELALIRYSASQIRVFAFYKNVPLIGAFLGLGLGCTLAGGRPRHLLKFVLWLVPLTAFLSAGSMAFVRGLSRHAAIGTSEHILGDFIPDAADRAGQLTSQLLMAGFCVVTFVVVTLLFALLGRLMGEAFNHVERLPGYTANIAGSLAGILAFIALGYLETPPAVWFAVGLAPVLWWAPNRAWAGTAGLLVLTCAAMVFPHYGDTVWSPYQKLVGHRVASTPGHPEADAYLVQISDVFYQVAVDRRPDNVARGGGGFLPHYDVVYRNIPRPDRVLVVGAGTGNDVAAALRAGAKQVDAVDIDPAIVRFGREHHPEQPYSDPRVNVIVDDARHAFRVLPAGSYDVVLFGLLDSHTQLGLSSVRLDNYVFTLESFREAARLVKNGGFVIVTAAAFEDWFRDRLQAMLQTTAAKPVAVFEHRQWTSYLAYIDHAVSLPPAEPSSVMLPTDDWPFLYLPGRAVPWAYVWVVGGLVLTSVVVLRLGGLPFGDFTSSHAHLFFLGAAFLLMEVHAINRLALLFGTTWLVSGVTIALVLLLIVGANLTLLRFGSLPYSVAYVGLALSLVVSYLIDPGAWVHAGLATQLGVAAVLLSPVFFAGLVFARSFAAAPLAAPAMGANILGSVLGGWIEYGTMVVGIRSLLLVAALFYALSAVLLVRRPK
ncbi:MAG: methyltransferase domain-containing protein [bacterium]|nr:methyltransferase domain-containing protein [bacterium]